MLTAKFSDSAEAFASEAAAMAFYENGAIQGIAKYNAEIEYGFFPIPAASAADTPTLAVGEGIAVVECQKFPGVGAVLPKIQECSYISVL